MFSIAKWKSVIVLRAMPFCRKESSSAIKKVELTISDQLFGLRTGDPHHGHVVRLPLLCVRADVSVSLDPVHREFPATNGARHDLHVPALLVDLKVRVLGRKARRIGPRKIVLWHLLKEKCIRNIQYSMARHLLNKNTLNKSDNLNWEEERN